MRRWLVALVVLIAGASAGAVVYTAYATDREYSRLIAAGDTAAGNDQPVRALEAYSVAIALRPDSMVAHLKRGMTYRQRGELEAALKDLRRASALDPTSTVALDWLGDTYLTVGRFDRAAERYAAFVALDDGSPHAWYKLGLAHYRAGAPEQAREPLQRAIALDRSLAEAHLLLGLSLRDEGQTRAARTAFETAAQIAPGLTAPREALAGLYAATGESSRAIDQLEALAALDPSRPDRFVALGLAHARARRHEAAVLTLSRAVERFPNEPRVYATLGHVWLEFFDGTGDEVALRKALEALTTAAAHIDVASDTLTDLGRARLMSGDAAGAERAFRQAVLRLPVQPQAYRELADLAARRSQFQDAREALIRYATLIGDGQPVAGVATQIASYSMRLGDRDVALKWIDRAIDESGSTPTLAALRRRAEAMVVVNDPAPVR